MIRKNERNFNASQFLYQSYMYTYSYLLLCLLPRNTYSLFLCRQMLAIVEPFYLLQWLHLFNTIFNGTYMLFAGIFASNFVFNFYKCIAVKKIGSNYCWIN